MQEENSRLHSELDRAVLENASLRAELNDAEVNGIVTELKKGLSALFTTCDPGVEGSAPTVQAALNAANNAIQSEVKARMAVREKQEKRRLPSKPAAPELTSLSLR